jgi:hypothetical protein
MSVNGTADICPAYDLYPELDHWKMAMKPKQDAIATDSKDASDKERCRYMKLSGYKSSYDGNYNTCYQFRHIYV